MADCKDTQRLIQRLRKWAEEYYNADIDEAADALEAKDAEIERLKAENTELRKVQGDGADEETIAKLIEQQAEIERLLEDKKTLSKAIMEFGELVPDKKFWACPTCTRVNPSTRKTCYMRHGKEKE